MAYSKQKEYYHLDERIEKDIIIQIRAIAELQNLSTNEVIVMCLKTGINFHQNNFALQERNLKVGVIDNKIVQIYPFLSKPCTNLGTFCTIQDKIMHFYVDLKPVLYKKGLILSPDLREKIELQAYDVFEYVRLNFPDEYSQIKDYLLKNPRNKAVKGLFRQKKERMKKAPEEPYIVNNTNSVTESLEVEKARKGEI